MVDLAQATLEQDCVFMNFRKVIKAAMHCVLTNEVLLELDEETFIRNYVLEKLQENVIIKKIFNGCQPITRRQKMIFSLVSRDCQGRRRKIMNEDNHLNVSLSSDLETSFNEVNHCTNYARLQHS